MVAGWTVFGLLWIVGIGLVLVKHFKFRQYDPNTEDQEARIAAGKSRAITAAEFEAAQKDEHES